MNIDATRETQEKSLGWSGRVLRATIIPEKAEGEVYVSGGDRLLSVFLTFCKSDLKYSLNDSLDTDLYVLRTDWVGDEDCRV